MTIAELAAPSADRDASSSNAVEQKLGKYAGILRPIIADAERRCSLAEAQLLGTQQRLDKLQKAQK